MARSRAAWMDRRKVPTHREATAGSTVTNPIAITSSSLEWATVRDRLHQGNSAMSAPMIAAAIASWIAIARHTTRNAHDRVSAR